MAVSPQRVTISPALTFYTSSKQILPIVPALLVLRKGSNLPPIYSYVCIYTRRPFWIVSGFSHCDWIIETLT
jgi:hypothetical protein